MSTVDMHFNVCLIFIGLCKISLKKLETAFFFANFMEARFARLGI